MEVRSCVWEKRLPNIESGHERNPTGETPDTWPQITPKKSFTESLPKMERKQLEDK